MLLKILDKFHISQVTRREFKIPKKYEGQMNEIFYKICKIEQQQIHTHIQPNIYLFIYTYREQIYT